MPLHEASRLLLMSRAHLFSFALTRNRAPASRIRNPCEAETETNSRLARKIDQIDCH